MTDLITQRIDAYTTEGHHWNAWPDKAEIVKVEEYPTDDPMAMFDFGQLLGRADGYRQIAWPNIPAEIEALLPENAYGNRYGERSLVYTHFTLVGARGQEDDAYRRNLYALFPPQARWDHETRAMVLKSSHALAVEIGCKHEYSDAGSNHRRGYHKGLCTRCGHKWMCDSGD